MLEASAGEPAEERLARLRERLQELAGGDVSGADS
jgi:hypothetical protein